MTTNRKEAREALPPQVVEAARKSLVISAEDAELVLGGFNEGLTPVLRAAVAQAETDLKLRAALNRILFTSRNATFAFACREALAAHKQENKDVKP
jgi:hypothetical protein